MRCIVVAVTMLAAGCSAVDHMSVSTAAQEDVQRLRWLDSADVQADFQRHVIRDHDTRFVGVYGYTGIVPGVDEHLEARLKRQNRVRYIEGTSDAILSSEHDRLDKKASEYARQDNLLLLSYLRSTKKT